METIIKKAIEGGYDIGDNFTFVKNSSSHIHLFIRDSKKSFVLDPLFWQAIGRAKGWSKYACSWDSENSVCRKWCSTGHRETWLWSALRFHEINLTEGWDKAVEYLKEITNI